MKCKACRQVKGSEDALIEAQKALHKQSKDLVKLKEQVKSLYDKNVRTKKDLNEMHIEYNRMQAVLNKKIMELKGCLP